MIAMRGKKVKLRNPDLPGQPIWVFEAAVPAYAAGGWEPDNEPEPDKPKFSDLVDKAADKAAEKGSAPAAEEAPQREPGDPAQVSPALADKPSKPSRKSTPPGPSSAPQGADRGSDPASTEE